MKRLAIFLVLAFSAGVSGAAAQTQITLLHINDTHSRLAPWGPKDVNLDGTIGGLTKAASIIASEKFSHPESTLLVHAGDFFEGDLFFNEYAGVAELQLLQGLGLDALLVGNHEFHLTPDFLAFVLATSGIGNTASVISTNLANCPSLSPFISPTAIREVSGVNVGFFGLTLPPASDLEEQLQNPPAPPCVIDSDFVTIAGNAVAQLRNDGAQVVVGLAHLGLDSSRAIAAAVPGIDVIVNAHDHVALAQAEKVTNPNGGTTLIVSAGALYRWVGRLRLSVDGDQVTLVDYALLPVDAGTPELPPVLDAVTFLKTGIVARYGDVYHHPIGAAEEPILSGWDPRHAKRDTAIGDVFTDAYRAWTGTDIAVEVTGNLDVAPESIPEGTIVPVDVYRTMGLGIPDPGSGIVSPLRLATFQMTGAQLIAGLEFGVAFAPLQVSGMRFDYDSRRQQGQQILLDKVHVGGHLLELNRVYTVTANEGLLFLLPQIGIEVSDATVLPETAVGAVIDFIEHQGTLDGGTSGRIRDVAAIKGSKSRH